MAEINMVPLLDVMLVLLVIFIVTAPLLTQAVKLELPKASSQANDLRPEEGRVRDRRGRRLLLERRAGLARRGAEALRRRGRQPVQPGDPPEGRPGRRPTASSPRALADASKAGLTKVGFISQPEPGQ
jgi:biopolymer transport protein ExbD